MACGALLVAAPLVPIAYDLVGVGMRHATVAVTITCLVAGMLFGSDAALRGWGLPPRRRATLRGWAMLAVAVLGAAFTLVSAAQWYAQFRSLCEYGPHPELHGERCPD